MNPYEPFPILRSDLAMVDQVIRQRLESQVVLIRTIGDYIIGAGGKRLRPVLLLLVARALGYAEIRPSDAGQAEPAGAQHHWLMAAVVEFIHTATLLHDDVVDESTLRRGRDTANARFGNPASVLVGDFLYSRAFQMMVETQNLRILDILADATNTIAEGEVLQLLNIHDPDVTEERYLQVIRFKTARLFEAAARIGAVLAGGSPEQERAAADYGRHLGTAFQLVDDLLDYAGDSTALGKNIGDDLREGKPTLPLLRVMAVGSPADQQRVRQAIETGGTGDLAAIQEAVRRTGALDYTADCARREAQRASDALAHYPPSIHRDALIHLSAYSVTRTQ